MHARTLMVAAAATALLGLAAPAHAGGASPHGSHHAHVCDNAAPGAVTCHARVVLRDDGLPNTTVSTPTGLNPLTIKSVYGFPTAVDAGAGTTIAIVDAHDDPSVERDLGVFDSQFGLPACTTNNGCFRKVDQNGRTHFPGKDAGWALEISLDVEWAHAIAPGAKILLVEANSTSLKDLLTAEDFAKAHANYVSNSWGTTEFTGETTYDRHFVQAGVSVFASSGDNGLPAQYPSASPAVVSVGGTSLQFSSPSVLSNETGWSFSGGGCSAYEPVSAAQQAFAQYATVGCGGKRATPDVALDADPASGVAVYDSNTYQTRSGWFTLGGTSAATPMWAARAAVAGTIVDANYVYGTSISYRDITSGNNGAPCLVGYDLVTGRGSWATVTP